MATIDKDLLLERIDRLLKLHNYAREDWFANTIHNTVWDAPEIETDGDTIYRSDAIDAVCRDCTMELYGKEECEVYKNGNCGSVNAISALPSADAVSREAIMSAKFHPLPYTHITPTDADAESYKRGWNDALDAVADNAPSAEAVHGEWIDTGNWMGVECSRCKCHSRYVTPFCPQCGARMLREDGEA